MVKYKKRFQKDLHSQSDYMLLICCALIQVRQGFIAHYAPHCGWESEISWKICVIIQEKLVYAVYINIYLKACFWCGPMSTFCSILLKIIKNHLQALCHKVESTNTLPFTNGLFIEARNSLSRRAGQCNFFFFFFFTVTKWINFFWEQTQRTFLILLESGNKLWNVFSHGCSLLYCEKTVLLRSPAFTRSSAEKKIQWSFNTSYWGFFFRIWIFQTEQTSLWNLDTYADAYLPCTESQLWPMQTHPHIHTYNEEQMFNIDTWKGTDIDTKACIKQIVLHMSNHINSVIVWVTYVCMFWHFTV